MFNLFRTLNLRKIVLVSFLIGSLFGTISVFAGDDLPSPSGKWKCPDGGLLECTAAGCVKSSSQPDSYWVCRYVGEGCPPLEACVFSNGL